MTKTTENEMTNNEIPTLKMIVQYLKDLSFESTQVPDILFDNKLVANIPNIDISTSISKHSHLDNEEDGGNHFEVVIKLKIGAKVEESILFIMELEYAGLFYLKNIQEEYIESTLAVECPRIIFPFVREIVSRTSQLGGFTPLLLDPIDFAYLYSIELESRQKGN